MLESNQLKFSMYGELDDVRITTQVTGLQLRCSGYVSETDTLDEEPDKDMYIVLSGRVDSLETGLLLKSDLGHTHTMSDITDFGMRAEDIEGLEENIGNEIRRACRLLSNRIRRGSE